MKLKIFTLALAATLVAGCNKDFLTRLPKDQLTDDTFWTSETNVRAFAYRFYPDYFSGFGTGYTWRNYFYLGQGLNDDFSPTTPNAFTKQVPVSSSGWSFTKVRDANYMLARVSAMDKLDAATKNHWVGVARFFRAIAYSNLVNSYGDVPYFDRALDVTELAELFKPRDNRTLVMDKVLEDLDFAAANVRAVDGEKGLNVTKWVVLSFMSRYMLFEGTWQKYHLNNAAKAAEYLGKAKWAAKQVIDGGGYSFSHPYRESFNALDLAGNKEIIMYRSYVTSMVTHSMMSYVNAEGQTGVSKDLVETYLCNDGLPISLSPRYQGDKTITDVLANRDLRLSQTINPELRPMGSKGRYNNLGVSTSGYATWKFLNDALRDKPNAASNTNDSDAPVIRYGEVLMNYAEACAETGNITQAELDASINVLRARAGVPPLQVNGTEAAVGGAVYDDPARDADVSGILWEIRRERRVELSMEGFRLDDLRRWKKLHYLDTELRPNINRGAWIKRSEWLKPNGTSWLVDVTLTGADEGYIIPSVSVLAHRKFDNARVYLDPIPSDQIKVYSDRGYKLVQNKDW
ncbi:RagB/SusD family nutrient uptake outer membrane protein [Chitinophaga deserti]|uniref:RagB/SusD family nutrient uptake outer membrane protein n=1 Tax=Chitinophaga deserti TaxID=2164099 RepID=UPI000D6DA974|nr:RagB/SusD family nutrient uptake outer membrane protein [Chitinophaga deserti]